MNPLLKDLPITTERLLAVATYMEEIAERPPQTSFFDMGNWGVTVIDDEQYNEDQFVHDITSHTPADERVRAQEINCHTAACAIGHCAMHPWFAERGLTFAVEKLDEYSNHLFMAMGYEGKRRSDWMPKFFGYEHLDRGSSGKDLDLFYQLNETVGSFFVPRDGNMTPSEVAENIRNFIHDHTTKIDLGDPVIESIGMAMYDKMKTEGAREVS